MNRVYVLSWDKEQVCYVVAPSPTQAKSIAMRDSPKARECDYISLNAKLAQIKDIDTSIPLHVADVHTYEDMIREETRWYWSQQ